MILTVRRGTDLNSTISGINSLLSHDVIFLVNSGSKKQVFITPVILRRKKYSNYFQSKRLGIL